MTKTRPKKQNPKLLQVLLLVFITMFLLNATLSFSQSITNESFDQWRANDPTIITQLLKEMPKGGELHSHLSGAVSFDDLIKLASNNDYRVFIDNENIGFVLPFEDGKKLIRPTEFQEKCTKDPTKCHLIKNLTDTNKEKLKLAVTIDKNDLKSTEKDSYKSFLDVFDSLDDLTDNADLIPELVKLAMIDASMQNVSYLELKLSPYGRSDTERKPVKIETLLKNINNSIKDQNKKFESLEKSIVTTKIIAQIDRRDPLKPGGMTDLEPIKCTKDCYLRSKDEYLHSRLRQAFYLATLSPFNNLVVGIDFVGLPEYELSTKPDLNYMLGSLRAEFGNVNMTIHAGESKRPGWYDHVSGAVELGAQRIGHGVNLVKNMESWDLICQKGIPIEINLTSNVLLGVVDKLEDHPFPMLFNQRNCAVFKKEKDEFTNDPITLSTDNAGIFQTNMSNEFCLGAIYFDLSWEEIKQLARNSLKYSFSTPSTKRILIEKWEIDISNFENKWKTKSNKLSCKYPSLN